MMMMLRRIDIQKKHTWFHGHGLFRNCTLLFKKLQKNYRHPVEEELLGSWTISFNQREIVTLVYKSVFILELSTVCTVNNAICCKSSSQVIKSEDCIYMNRWHFIQNAYINFYFWYIITPFLPSIRFLLQDLPHTIFPLFLIHSSPPT